MIRIKASICALTRSRNALRNRGTWMSAKMAACGALAACGADSGTIDGTDYDEVSAALATYQVGPGKPYVSLQAVQGLLQPGDVVEVFGGATYAGGVRFSASGTATSKITIRGVPVNGVRPKISGGTNTVEFSANHYIFENFDVTGGSSRCVFHHGHDITIRGSVVHDCPAHGILGADSGSGSLLLERTEVYRSGSGTNLHQIYMATDEQAYPGAVFRMQHCYVHDGLGGNNVKSRAERNEIYYNWIEGAYYHELELIGPDGQAEGLAREDSDVVGNVVFQGYGTRTHYPIRIGGDGTGQTWGRFRFLNNTIVLGNATTSAVFRAFDGIESVEMHNNVLYRQGGGPVNVFRDAEAAWKAGRVVTGSRNWIVAGSTAVPSTWTGTLSGTSPGFVDVAGRNVRLASGSALVNVGNPSPTSPAGHAFSNPLLAATMEPPLHAILAGPAARPAVSTIDIGAYELGSATSPPPSPTPAPAPTTPPPSPTPAPTTPPPSPTTPPTGDTPLTVLPLADAYVEAYEQANVNFGGALLLFSATNDSAYYNRDTYLKFDLSGVARVSSAKLRISAALTSTASGTLTMSAYAVPSSSWTELAITWSNKPARGAAALSTANVNGDGYVWYELDVTSFVASEKAAGRSVVALALHNPAPTSARVLMPSRETSSGPRLVVTQ